jgi:hypothetical protein
VLVCREDRDEVRGDPRPVFGPNRVPVLPLCSVVLCYASLFVRLHTLPRAVRTRQDNNTTAAGTHADPIKSRRRLIQDLGGWMTGGYACCASCALHLQAAAGGAQKPGIGQQAASPPEAAANNRPPRQRPWSPIDSPIVHHNDAQKHPPALGENRLTHQNPHRNPLAPLDRPLSSTAQRRRRPPRPCSVQGVKCTEARLAMSPPSWPLSAACAGKWLMGTDVRCW